MAASTFIFDKLNFKQIETVVKQRQLSGAHSYYTRTWETKVVDVALELPGLLKKDVVFTVVYEYTAESVNNSTIHLGTTTDQIKNRIAVSGDYKLTYYWSGQAQYRNTEENRKLIKTPSKGFHVIQFRHENSSIVVFLDNVQIAENGKIVGRENKFVLFRTVRESQDKTDPFRLWESHFTAPNPVVDFDRKLGYMHYNFKILAGSYVQFSGYWTNKPRIIHKAKKLEELDTAGEAVLTLNVYGASSRVSNGLDAMSVKKLNAAGFDMSHLVCNKPSKLYDITVVVGDYSMA